MTLTLLAFIAGSVVATFHMPFWWNTPSLGEVLLGDTLGWTGAGGVQLAAFALVTAVTWWIERRRGGRESPGRRRLGDGRGRSAARGRSWRAGSCSRSSTR